MYLDARAVERHGFDLDAYHLSTLQLLEHPVENPCLGPAIHARVDGVPIAEPLGQSTPLAAMLCDVEHCVQHRQIRQADVAALRGKAMFDLVELGLRDLHA